MNAVRLGDVLDPEKNLREWAKRGGESPQKGSPAAAMQWAVAEIERLRAVIGLAEILVTALDNTGRLHAIDGGPELAAAIRRG